ncbi:serine/threonine protein kinase [Rubrivivax albus]|uniref:serine/threonine protein kinase n=1 Tax=Rubrivivax albus TaxID=2499835 RepID=UPI001E5916DC|nr:serine/threonine protein kinase [Rubrivivax albus]
MNAAHVAGRRVGRFELLRQLGRGAQATVWLGYDARLDREVAIKLLDPQAAELQEWLHEARAVSRLTHPNIVPVFEADTADGQPMLVFEYVDGGTLADARRGKGPMPPREAVALMTGVLAALAAAHAQGIVHRDLKPSNLLLSTDGRARVMDFGIAARVAGGGDGRIAGTPGYMSPEAARGEPPAPQMDVFAAGMLLGELLAGMPLMRERDPYRAIHRVQHEDFAVPAHVRIDDTLRAIVARAVARDPRQRYDGAASFRDALVAWANPTEQGDAAAGGGHGTLEFLLRRMKHKRDFPALGESIVRIQRIASSETESLASLSAEILKDVALTNKLLRMVNTVHFANAGAGNISTISRAVALVGFAGIRNMALSVVLLDHMQDQEHAAQIREEFLRGLMAGTLAAELTPNPREAEETFIGAMFQNLGRMLTQYYFPEEAQQIRQSTKGSGMAAEDKAAVKVLGLSYGELGVGVAKSWDLPDTLQRMMAMPDGEPPAKGVDKGTERQRWIGRIANEITDTMLGDDVAGVDARIGRLADEFAPALGLPRRTVLGAAEAARERLTQLADALGLHVTPDAPASRLMVPPHEAPTDTLAPHQLTATAHSPLDDGLTIVLDDRPADEPAGPPASELLASGIQDITNSMVADGFKLNEVLRMVLETMYRALGFRRVIFCLRDPKTETLTGRFGLGDDVDAVKAAFKVPLKPAGAPDLFTAICTKGMDTLIADATAANVAQRLPAWYRSSVNAPTFLLLPMAMKGKTFALIYADKGRPGGIEVDEKELSLLRTLRNQAVMAFRQLGS